MEGLGAKLKELRQGERLSQQALARELGTSQNNIYRYENDVSEPSVGMLIKYADRYGMTIDDLVGHVKREGIADTGVGAYRRGSREYDAIKKTLIKIITIDEEVKEEIRAILHEHSDDSGLVG